MPLEVQQETADAEVVRWRQERLLHAGVPRQAAWRLARDWRYDLHALIELVEHGCRPDLAIRILAPLETKDAA